MGFKMIYCLGLYDKVRVLVCKAVNQYNEICMTLLSYSITCRKGASISLKKVGKKDNMSPVRFNL